jgi:DNA-binding LacI/PurR family transcriptional regulator
MEGASFLKAPGLPRVAFMNRPEFTDAAQVALGGNDSAQFFEKAVKHLLGRGRRRIALLTVPGISGRRLDSYRKQLVDLGLPVDPCWMQTATQVEPQWASNLVMLLFKGKPEERPNGLIIADDNLTEHACTGLLQAGLSVPKDVDVVAHGNFPLEGKSLLPIKRLGYDIPAALNIALDLLQRQREGKKVPPVTVVPAVFEEDATGGRTSE